MAAKSIINELYQRLRAAAPVYCTKADEGQRPGEGFDCALTLPAGPDSITSLERRGAPHRQPEQRPRASPRRRARERAAERPRGAAGLPPQLRHAEQRLQAAG